MSVVSGQVASALNVLRTVADAIKAAESIPSGRLYAQLMGVMDLATYEKIIGILKNTGLVTESTHHMLSWVEPQ